MGCNSSFNNINVDKNKNRNDDELINTRIIHHKNMTIEIKDDTKIVSWFRNGKLHRDHDLPAQIIYKKEQNNEKTYYVEEELWFRNGKLYREDNPARICYYKNRNENFDNSENRHVEEWYEQAGKLSRRNDLPTKIIYNPSIWSGSCGSIRFELWLNENNILNRNEFPASIQYYDNCNKIQCERWYDNGKRKRKGNLPAVIIYNQNGVKMVEKWFKNDILNKTSFVF